MPTITRRLSIDAGHRLMGHEGKCRNYHGHRYDFDITVDGASLDAVGRVIDFGVVKELVGGWLDEQWDHGMVLERGDALIRALVEASLGLGHERKLPPSFDERVAAVTALTSPKLYVIDVPPTAENLSRLLFEKATELLAPHGVRVVRVTCWETPNCSAEYTVVDAASVVQL